MSIDEAGHQLGSIRVAHSPEGLSQLDTYLERIAGAGGKDQVACIVETTHGLLIAHLGKSHTVAVRYLANIWARILYTVWKTKKLYQTTTFERARLAHAPRIA